MSYSVTIELLVEIIMSNVSSFPYFCSNKILFNLKYVFWWIKSSLHLKYIYIQEIFSLLHSRF